MEPLSRLRASIVEGLEHRLHTLTSFSWYRQWRIDAGLKPGPLSPPSTTDDGANDIIEDPERRKLAAMLKAIDRVLLSLPLDQMPENMPSLESIVEEIRPVTFVPGSSPSSYPASHWIHASMKYGQYRAKARELISSGQKKDLDGLYSSYVVFAQALVVELVRHWSLTVVAGEKARLGLPSVEEARLKGRAHEREFGVAEGSSRDDATNWRSGRPRLFK